MSRSTLGAAPSGGQIAFSARSRFGGRDGATLAMSSDRRAGVEPDWARGTAGPYVFAAIGVTFVAYGFLRSRSHPAHADRCTVPGPHRSPARRGSSARGRCSAPPSCLPASSIMGIPIFGQAFLRSTDGSRSSPPWWPIALAGWAVIPVTSLGGVRTTTRLPTRAVDDRRDHPHLAARGVIP